MRQDAPAAPSIEGAAGKQGTPWEARETVGFFKGLFRSIKQVLFSPTEFFRSMSISGGLTDPLVFALIVGMTGISFSYTWQVMLHGSLQHIVPSDLVRSGAQVFEGMNLAILALLSPFLLIMGSFLGAGLLHLLLLMVRGAKGGFEATFRVVCYSFGPNVFLILPFCGGVLATIWTIVITIIGLREAHGITGGKAAFAVLFPILLCCGVLVLFMVMFMGALAASFGLMHQ